MFADPGRFRAILTSPWKQGRIAALVGRLSATSSSMPEQVSPMLPVYSVPDVPGCYRQMFVSFLRELFGEKQDSHCAVEDRFKTNSVTDVTHAPAAMPTTAARITANLNNERLS